LWLGAWGCAITLVVLFSLAPAFLLPQVPVGGDKAEHFLAYFVLAAMAVQLFATRGALLRSGVGLVALGIALEIAQALLTSTRQMDVHDALANTLGVLAGLATAMAPGRDLLLRYDPRG
jgi:VanZ family protein